MTDDGAVDILTPGSSPSFTFLTTAEPIQEHRRAYHKSPTTIVYSTYRIQIFKTSLLIVLLMALLSAPLYPLYRWTQTDPLDGRTIAMIMGLQCSCTLLFGTVLAACTKARRVEIFMACSA